MEGKLLSHWFQQVLTAVLLISIVSAIVNAVAFPEHGLTQFVFASDTIRTALWRGNTLTRIECDYDASRARGWKLQFVFSFYIGLTAVDFITQVSTVTPAITLKFLPDALLVFALELVWTSCGRKNIWEVHLPDSPKHMKKKVTKVEGSEALTVFNVDSLVRCLKTSVYVGFVGEKHHFHCVGLAGLSQLVVRMLATKSEDERFTHWHISPLVMCVCVCVILNEKSSRLTFSRWPSRNLCDSSHCPHPAQTNKTFWRLTLLPCQQGP